jgi:hypothetical protein
MGSMKILTMKTALHIAVFLSLVGSGCYTTLRAPIRIEPSTSQPVRPPAWDFSYAWYGGGQYTGSNHFFYYNTPWWYNRHSGPQDSLGNQPVVLEPNNDSGSKIERRNFDNFGGGSFVFPSQPAPATGTSGTIDAGTSTGSTSQPIINKTQKSEDDDTSGSGKITRRNRR